MRRRGFTLAELAVVLGCLAITVPLTYVFARSVETQRARGLWSVEVAEAGRSVAEELRLDLRTGTVQAGDALVLSGAAGCAGEVRYEVTAGHVLVRRAPAACGGERALARDVVALERLTSGATLSGVSLRFSREPSPGQVETERLVLPVGG